MVDSGIPDTRDQLCGDARLVSCGVSRGRILGSVHQYVSRYVYDMEIR